MPKALADITALHFARSVAQFDAMGVIMLLDWRLCGESRLAEWFEREYLTKPYNRWNVSASGVPGADPQQQPIESSHRDAKRDRYGQGPGVKVTIGVFCHESIGKQLRDASANAGQEPITLVAGGTVSREVYLRAKEMVYVETGFSNFFKVSKIFKLGRIGVVGVDGYIFNSSNHLWQSDKENKVTAEMCRVFLKSVIYGRFKDQTTWLEAQRIASQLHFVRMPSPGTYMCDCKAFWHGAECSHVEAAKHLKGDINILHELRKIVQGKRVGRPNAAEKEAINLSTHVVEQATNMSEIKAGSYCGTKIAARLHHRSHVNWDRIYVGRVGGENVSFCV